MVGVPHHGVVTGGCLPGSVSRELRRVEPIDQAGVGRMLYDDFLQPYRCHFITVAEPS